MEEAPLGLHPPEERRAGIRREDVEGRALQALLLDPVARVCSKHVRAVVVEAEHEAAVHLDAVAVEELDAPRVVLGARALLARRRAGCSSVEALEADEDARCSRRAPSRARASGSSVTSSVTAALQIFSQRRERPAQRAQVAAVRAEVVVDEDGVGRVGGLELARRPASGGRIWYLMRVSPVAR